MKNYFLISFLFLISSCTTTPTGYHSIVENNSVRKELHQGLVNILKVHATLLNSEVQYAQLEKKEKAFSWGASEKQQENLKVQESLSNQTSFFMSFYTPSSKVDDLDKIQTVWRLYLDVNGNRYEGKAVKQPGIYDEILEFYPYHTRFGTSYKIIFNVPSRQVENLPMKLTITGTLGTLVLDFKK